MIIWKMLFAITLLGLIQISQAKEVQLILNTATSYPMRVHYQFLSGNTILGEGKLDIAGFDAAPYHVAVNQIPDSTAVQVYIDKMSVANITEIHDPCEIDLGTQNLTARITIGVTGNPWQHGSFICTVAANS